VITDAIRQTGTYLMAFAYPNHGDSTFLDPIGLRLQDLYTDSFRALSARLRGIGFTEEERLKALTLDPSVTFEEQGEKFMRLLDAGYIGDGTRPVSKDPEDVDLAFDMLRNIIKAHPPTLGTVIQFDLTDVGPRHYLVSPDGLEYIRERHPAPSVSLKVSLNDLLDLIGERANPIKLILQRKLKITGDRGLLVGQRSIFGPPPASSARRLPLLEKLGF
jgi:hypothetical protein